MVEFLSTTFSFYYIIYIVAAIIIIVAVGFIIHLQLRIRQKEYQKLERQAINRIRSFLKGKNEFPNSKLTIEKMFRIRRHHLKKRIIYNAKVLFVEPKNKHILAICYVEVETFSLQVKERKYNEYWVLNDELTAQEFERNEMINAGTLTVSRKEMQAEKALLASQAKIAKTTLKKGDMAQLFKRNRQTKFKSKK